MSFRYWAMSVAIVLSLSSPAFSQVQSGTIAGTVTDAQGAVLPGVVVNLSSTDRTATFTTGTDGRYRFLALPPGRYRLSFELPGFRTVVQEEIEVRVGQNVELPVQMSVAAVQETVTVTGASPLVDARQMGTATNFTQDELSRVPNSRDPWALLRTVPGVMVDRVNIAGNETGQQSGYTAKGVPSTQSTWTLDGIVITDMAATGASPTYFDYDAFDEIQISTAGNDIRQPTGGVGLNFVVKRGTNQFRGGLKGFYTGDEFEGTNIPDELAATGVTPETADHNEEIMEWGGDLGGPILRDRLWFWGSYVEQDIRLYRRQVRGTDRTVLKTYNAKVNWQASAQDMFSFLWFNGDKEKYGRSTGFSGIEARTATWNQGGFFADGWPRGLWKVQNDRTWSSNFFTSMKYAYYNTGFTLDPIGGLEQQAGQSSRLGQSFGSTYGFYYLRPQHTINLDNDYFLTGFGGNHNVKFGFGWRRVDSSFLGLAPGNMIFAFDDPGFQYALLFREANTTNRTQYLNFYIGDTLTRDRLTLDVGLRYDRQGGEALPTTTRGNLAFPDLVPGLEFTGYESPFTWNNLSPRIGMTYAMDDTRRTILRASFSMAPGQLSNGFVGFSNPTGDLGWALYPWVDRNGDNLAQSNEVDLSSFITAGGGFNPNDPRSTTSPHRIDPDFSAPVTKSLVIGVDRELRPNLAVSLNYSFTRTDNFEYTPRLNPTTGGPLGPEHYEPMAPLTGTLPPDVGGGSFSVPLFRPNPAMVTAAGFGRLLTNYEGYYSQFNGIEFQLTKRMSNRWMGRIAASWNNPREYYDMAVPVNYLGNPTRRDTEPLIDGGLFAPRSAGSGAGDVFMSGRWSFNANAAYQLPAGFEIAGNLFGRDGTPLPLQRTTSLGSDTSQRVLVSPTLDTVELEKLWNLDLRVGKSFTGRVNAQIYADLFNVFNENVILNRIRNVAATTFFLPTQNLSPRILRLGVRVGF